MNLLKRLFGISTKRETGDFEQEISDIQEKNKKADAAATVDGEHYTDYVDLIKDLKRDNKFVEAKELLYRLVEATEKESEIQGWGVAPWYYEQIAIICRKEKNYHEEVNVLKRYDQQTKAPGSMVEKMAERLVKANELYQKNKIQ